MTTTESHATNPVSVRCPNGITTWHATITDAETYAEWGHVCVAANQHQITHHNPKETNTMTCTYTTTGKLTNPVTDLAAARTYLDEPMVDYIRYCDEALVPVVHDIRWDLLDEESWIVRLVTTRPLTDPESEKLSEWISGQNSDGLGEGFEQQPFAEHYDEGDDGRWGYVEGDDEITMSSFDWQDNPCTLTLVRSTEQVAS